MLVSGGCLAVNRRLCFVCPMSLDGPMPLIAQSSSFSSVRELIELKYPTIDYVVSHSELEESSQKLILDVFPAWKPQDLSWEQYTDGITNKLLKCTHKPTKTKVLIRAYGKNSELLIDRNQELIVSYCSYLISMKFQRGVFDFFHITIFSAKNVSRNSLNSFPCSLFNIFSNYFFIFVK